MSKQSVETTSGEILIAAGAHLMEMNDRVFDILTISKPTLEQAINHHSKVIAKLSSTISNTIEISTVEYLNQQLEFKKYGAWKRQDPGFPDAIFDGMISPKPGFEIKAWFPLSTEITARFKSSQLNFENDKTHIVMIAWIPEYIIYGCPKIIGIEVFSGLAVARARDEHYHKPPDYLVIEPGDTSLRTINLQQTNTSGYKFQGNKDEFRAAEEIVRSWENGYEYSPNREYQKQLRMLLDRFTYRLDTNFAKIDRVVHTGVEGFKSDICSKIVHGLSISEWNRLVNSKNKQALESALKSHLNIK